MTINFREPQLNYFVFINKLINFIFLFFIWHTIQLWVPFPFLLLIFFEIPFFHRFFLPSSSSFTLLLVYRSCTHMYIVPAIITPKVDRPNNDEFSVCNLRKFILFFCFICCSFSSKHYSMYTVHLIDHKLYVNLTSIRYIIIFSNALSDIHNIMEQSNDNECGRNKSRAFCFDKFL